MQLKCSTAGFTCAYRECLAFSRTLRYEGNANGQATSFVNWRLRAPTTAPASPSRMPIYQAVTTPMPFGGPHGPSRLLGGKWWGVDQLQQLGDVLRAACLCTPTSGLCAKSRTRGVSLPEVRDQALPERSTAGHSEGGEAIMAPA